MYLLLSRLKIEDTIFNRDYYVFILKPVEFIKHLYFRLRVSFKCIINKINKFSILR